MKTRRAPRAGTADDSRRKHRPRLIPKWLRDTQHLDAIARARCLMVLSVLSGEKPVTDAIQDTRISRAAYYQMETRALNAMLGALNPLATQAKNAMSDLSAPRVEALLTRIRQLEQDRRRTQRLLLLTRKSIRAPLTTGRRGRPPQIVLLGSTPSGKPRSRPLSAKAAANAASIPTRTGARTR